MSKKKKVSPADICKRAWLEAEINGIGFTTVALAQLMGAPANRNFYRILAELAKDGLLNVVRRLDEDGHTRKYYYSRSATSRFFVQERKIP